MIRILSFDTQLDEGQLADHKVQVAEALRKNVQKVNGHIPDTDLFVFDIDRFQDNRNVMAVAANKHHILERVKMGYIAIGFGGSKITHNGKHNYQVFDDGIHVENLAAQEILFDESHDVAKFFSPYQNRMFHNVVLSSFSGDVIAKNQSGQTVGYYRKHGDGHLFILPRPKDQSDFLGFFIQEVLPKLDTHIQLGINTEAAPSFLESVPLTGEDDMKQNIESQKDVIQAESQKLEEMLTSLDELQQWKELLWQTDTRLENVVQNTFSLLGIELETTDNDVDLHGKTKDGRKILIEVKGRKGGIKHEDYRQIYERKYSFDDNNPKDTIALLVGNAFRLLPLDQRPPEGQDFFSPHSVSSSEQHDIGLIRTDDLYEVVVDVLNNGKNIDKGQILESIFACAGVYKYSNSGD